MGGLAIGFFFVGLLVVILVHELAHYATARAFGFRVQEYFVGFGPRLWSFRRGEIEYGIKALPIGGYVKIAGMNPFETVPPEEVPRAYFSKPIWQRAIVIFAGPGSHFVIAALLFAVSAALFGVSIDRVAVTELQQINGHGSPAAAAGLQPGDVILRAGDVTDPDAQALHDLSTENAGQPMTFVVERDGQTLTFTITPELVTQDGQKIGRIGVVISPAFERVGPIGVATAAVHDVGISVAESIQTVGKVFGPQGIGSVFRALFSDVPRDRNGPTSVIGLSQAVGDLGAAGQWRYILDLLAFMTVFIGLVNLVPLPPFDGGHLALLVIEKVRGRAVDFRNVIPVAVTVIVLLSAFVLATALLDITQPILKGP